MLEIKGKYNVALCYANIIDPDAIKQIQRMCDSEFTIGACIRIMPDVHSGTGCTIGTTMTVVDKVVPNIVGVDIGCGMYTVELGNVDLDFEKLDEVVHTIPSGRDVWAGKKVNFELKDLRCYKELKKTTYLTCSLGTLGGGNHFIEVDEAKDGNKYLIVHSGSRNLGKQVAEYYQQLAINLNKGIEEYFAKRELIIKEYKTQGRSKEIQKTLQKMAKEWNNKKTTIDEDICYLYGKYLEDYLHDVEICQRFAKLSREKMAEVILKKLNLKAKSNFHTIHNYIDVGEKILRKGAISAKKGEKLLIPINMRDGCILAYGKGNEEWNYSAPHGAGRIMSRAKAKDTLDIEEYKKEMEGVYTTSVCQATIDEAPMAYKRLNDIIDVVQDTVEIIEVLKPIYNYKASQ